MAGSVRRRGRDSWQLRVYVGTDADTGRERWVTTTVHGSRRHALDQLELLAAEAGHAHLRAGTLAELLERWFEAAAPNWATTTAHQTRSILNCHLIALLGHLPVDKLTPADIDDCYAHLLRRGGTRGGPLRPGTVHRVHVVLHRALAQGVAGIGSGSTRPAPPAHPAFSPPPRRNPAAHARAAIHPPRGRRNSFTRAVRLPPPGGVQRRPAQPAPRPVLGEPRLPPRRGHLHPVRRHRSRGRGARADQDAPDLPGGLDADTVAVLVEHRTNMAQRVQRAGYELGESAFVFSGDPDGHSPWLPNWVTKQFIAARRAAAPPGSRTSACTIWPTSWPPVSK